MGNLAVTPAQVQPVAGGQIMNGFAGEDVDAGEVGYHDGASDKWKLESADVDTSNSQVGIFEASAAFGQPCVVQCEGAIDLGIDAGVVEGKVYVISPTPGKITTRGDGLMVAGKYVKLLGIGAAANCLKVKAQNTDQQVQ